LNRYPQEALQNCGFGRWYKLRTITVFSTVSLQYLDEERKIRDSLKKKYTKLSNICLGTTFFIIISELVIVGTSIAVPMIGPVSVIISVALTTCSTILKSVSRLINKKNNKYSGIELLAKAKLN
jgi:hypothetical protein